MNKVIAARRRRPAARRAAAAALLMLGGSLATGSFSAAEAAIGFDACGTVLSKAGGGKWSCTFVDNFDSRTLDSRKWVTVQTAANGYRIGPECYVASANNVAVRNGALQLTARREAAPFTCKSPYGDFTTQYTGGFVTTWSKFAQAYGRFEFRAKMPSAKVAGVHSAMWLYPNDQSKYGLGGASGEIDVAEYYSAYPDRVIPYVHYNGDADDANATNNYCMMTSPENFHTYLLEWTPTTITISYDGAVCIRDSWSAVGLTSPAPFDQPFFLNLTQGLGLEGTLNQLGSTTPLPAVMQVDYVKVWS